MLKGYVYRQYLDHYNMEMTRLYVFAAESFHTKKLCNRLYSSVLDQKILQFRAIKTAMYSQMNF